MSGDKLREIGKTTVLPIQLGLLLGLLLGVWALAFRVHSWEVRLAAMERSIGYRWTWRMEEAAWEEFSLTGQAPNVEKIRKRYAP